MQLSLVLISLSFPFAGNPVRHTPYSDTSYFYSNAPAGVAQGAPVGPRYITADRGGAALSPQFLSSGLMSSGGPYTGVAPSSNMLHIQQKVFNVVNPPGHPGAQGKHTKSCISKAEYSAFLFLYIYVFYLIMTLWRFFSLSALPAKPCGFKYEHWVVSSSKHVLPGLLTSVCISSNLITLMQCTVPGMLISVF